IIDALVRRGILAHIYQVSEALQGLYMSDNAVGKAIQPVSTFQDRNNTPLAEFVGKVHDNTSHRREASRCDVELAENVVSHSIKAGADKDEIRFELASCRHELVLERVEELRVAGTRRHGYIHLRAECPARAGFLSTAGPRISAVMMGIEDEHGVVLVKDLL